jgi:hypothetical protein
MKTTKKGLQKFTKSEEKINKILALEKISIEDISMLSKTEYKKLFEQINIKFQTTEGNDKEVLLYKIEDIISNTVKNEIWENNHTNIMCSISKLIKELGRMPTKNEIVFDTKLSRTTIHKHIKDYKHHPMFIDQIEQLRFMSSLVLSKVLKFALNGDMKAAKLYLNVIGNTNGQMPNNTLIQNQNNYIQINGITLSQETIKQMNPIQLKTIEDILKTTLSSAELLKTN